MAHPDAVQGGRISMKRVLIASAIVSLMAVPAAAQSTSKGRAAGKEPVYCLQFSSETGSRISRMECRTKKDWERLGVELDKRSN
jgi:hypothetical protein